MTGVIFIFVTRRLSVTSEIQHDPVLLYPKCYWSKEEWILRPLGRYCTPNRPSALVVLSLAVGIFTVSFLINTESLLRIAFDREYAVVNPSSATLIIPEGFDQDFVEVIRRMPEIQNAEGRRSVNVRLRVGMNQWINLNLSAIDDFNDRTDRHSPGGAWRQTKVKFFERTSCVWRHADESLRHGNDADQWRRSLR
jgi:hypothetical protein